MASQLNWNRIMERQTAWMTKPIALRPETGMRQDGAGALFEVESFSVNDYLQSTIPFH
jgi:hypothetical protein